MTIVKMKAIQFWHKDKGPVLTETIIPKPGKNEMLIQLHAASLNHLDLWIWREQVLTSPVISGSDGSGVVCQTGENVSGSWLHKEVVINPSMYWGDDEKMCGNKYKILGNPIDGTFAEYMIIPQAYVYEKPTHLTMKEAAALPMAALTAYRALFTKAGLCKGENVLITGIGGGVALAAMQMAVAAGALVYVTSSSCEKVEKAVALGAKAGFNYKNTDWADIATDKAGGFDVIIDSAGGNGFTTLTEVANPGARMILFGRTAGNINHLKPGIIFNKQLRIEGTVMGTDSEFQQMLLFYQQHGLHPVIAHEFGLHQVEAAVATLESGKNFGKMVFAIGPH